MSAAKDLSDSDDDREPQEKSWTCQEIERLYRQALETVEAVAQDIDQATGSLSVDDDSLDSRNSSSNPTPLRLAAGTVPGETRRHAEPGLLPAGEETERLLPQQVIEALLFVGGPPLTAAGISGVLRGEMDAEFVERTIDELNQQYEREKRPYEVRQAADGYRMSLRADWEPLRNRVYGFGPKQVRLSQEALETLAIIAYRQPISRQGVEVVARRGAASQLRQLVQRDLLVVERTGDKPADVTYRTSARFLQLFGLARLDQLPQAQDIALK